jgi:Flp pilus assembly pilin Flp
MLNFIKNFRNDEDGAVTVDFVVLTAAIVLLGLAVGTAVGNGANNLANGIQDNLNTQADNL